MASVKSIVMSRVLYDLQSYEERSGTRCCGGNRVTMSMEEDGRVDRILQQQKTQGYSDRDVFVCFSLAKY